MAVEPGRQRREALNLDQLFEPTHVCAERYGMQGNISGHLMLFDTLATAQRLTVSTSMENCGQVWNLIKNEHSAVLVTMGRDGLFDARPMGCIQRNFNGTLWFMTFKNTPKLLELGRNQHALVSYARPKKYEFACLSGRARLVDDRSQVHALWFEGLRVWFPEGPDSSEIALIAIDVEIAKVWTKPASLLTYAYFYVRARLTGRSPTARQIVEHKVYRF